MKIKQIFITAALLGTWFSAMAIADQTEHLEALIEQGEYQAALLEIEKVTEPDVSLLKLKAVSHLKLEQYHKAEQSYLLVQQHDDGVDVSNNLGLVYLRQARFTDAITAFQSTIRRFPNDTAAYKNLGDIYLYLAQATYAKGIDSTTDNRALQTKADQVAAFFEAQAKELVPVVAEAQTETQEQAQTLNAEPISIEHESSASNYSDASEVDAGIALVESEAYKAQQKSIESLLSLWAKARSDNDRNSYFGFYQTGAVVSELVKNESDGNVRALEPSVQLLGERKASVVFDEWTGPYSKRTRLFKELQLALSDDGWKITQESVVHVYES